ncbi:hypothetical protein [Ascidiimonas sp. W6]|uniref:DoxX family protein n=1 Tax=Ascidiimonas meishanensis TaxID=3128903 RepID=UPI0030EBFCA1
MLTAGLYHFVNPQFYLPLIPDYLPYPNEINTLSGMVEILFALLLLSIKTRKIASLGIIILLVAFIPSHVYFIQTGSCAENSLCVSPWIAYIRLLLIHPLLIYWAWFVGTIKTLKS